MRRLVDARRSESARRRREELTVLVPGQGPTEQGDDTLALLFLCCHPELAPASQVARTPRPDTSSPHVPYDGERFHLIDILKRDEHPGP